MREEETDAPTDELLSVCETRLLSQVEQASLRALEKLTAGGQGVPHSAELLEAIYDICGGPTGLAAILMDQYRSIPAGKPGRTRILECVIRTTVQNTQLGGANKPLHLMEDAELELELERRMKKMVPPRLHSPQSDVA